MLVSAAPTRLPFLFFSPTLALSLPLCALLRLSFYLKLSGRSGRNCLLFPPALSGYNGSPETNFSWETTGLMSWPDRERYSYPLQSFVVSLLLSIVSTFVLSRPGGLLSHLNSSTNKFPFFPPRNLCSLLTLAVLSLSASQQRTQPPITLLPLRNRGSFMQNLRPSVPGHFSSHSALSSYRLFVPLALWQLSVFLRPLVQTLGGLYGFWGSIVFRHAPHPSKRVE